MDLRPSDAIFPFTETPKKSKHFAMDVAALDQLIQQSTAPKGPEVGWDFRLETLNPCEVRLREALKKYTSIQIGGLADAVVFPRDEAQLATLLKFAKDNRVPWVVLGRGSNVLIRDGGIRGLVIRLSEGFDSMEILHEDDQSISLRVGVGYSLPKLVEAGRKGAWQGAAALYGIPASLGGALWMNAGTRAGEIGERVLSVKVMHADGSLETYPAKRLKFEYRKLQLPQRGILLEADLQFTKGEPQEILATFQEYQQNRRASQPLDQASLGSVFKNPEKGFAAQMIEELGLKGVRVGGARISEKHANFIVNEGGACAKDVLALIGLVKDRVREEHGVLLEVEAKTLGDDEPL